MRGTVLPRVQVALRGPELFSGREGGYASAVRQGAVELLLYLPAERPPAEGQAFGGAGDGPKAASQGSAPPP
ncbi:MAG: hypothetical protein FWG93_07465, partial [Oscillospiraceae bacterium]|nr:hypothetical protein [Oscillospiraceae bacterium]